MADTRTARSFKIDSTTSSRCCSRAISSACVVATAARRGRRARESGGNVTFGVVLETVFLRARSAGMRRCAPLSSVMREVHVGACVVPHGAILRAGRALCEEFGEFSSHGVHKTHWHKGSAAQGPARHTRARNESRQGSTRRPRLDCSCWLTVYLSTLAPSSSLSYHGVLPDADADADVAGSVSLSSGTAGNWCFASCFPPSLV